MNHLPCQVTLIDWNGEVEIFCLLYASNLFERIPIWRKCRDLSRVKVEFLRLDGGTQIMYYFSRKSEHGGRDFEHINPDWRDDIPRYNLDP